MYYLRMHLRKSNHQPIRTCVKVLNVFVPFLSKYYRVAIVGPIVAIVGPSAFIIVVDCFFDSDGKLSSPGLDSQCCNTSSHHWPSVF